MHSQETLGVVKHPRQQVEDLHPVSKLLYQSENFF